MMKAIQKLKKNLAFVVGLSILMIPVGLLLWLIYSWGWKIAIAALILGVTAMVVYLATDRVEREVIGNIHDQEEAHDEQQTDN